MTFRITIEEYAKNFGTRPVPVILQKLLEFQNTVGCEYSYALYLNYCEPADVNLEYYEGHLHQLITFAYCDSNGNEYTLWDNVGNPDIEQWPVVLFDTEGGHTIMGRSLAEFLSTTWCDREAVGDWIDAQDLDAGQFGGGYLEAQDDDRISKLADAYKLFLAQELKLDTTQDPDAVVKRAQTELMRSFSQWHLQFDTRYNEEVERYEKPYADMGCEHIHDLARLTKRFYSQLNRGLLSEAEMENAEGLHGERPTTLDIVQLNAANAPSHSLDTNAQQASFSVYSLPVPTHEAINRQLRRSDSNFQLMEYDPQTGRGCFLIMAGNLPSTGRMILPALGRDDRLKAQNTEP